MVSLKQLPSPERNLSHVMLYKNNLAFYQREGSLGKTKSPGGIPMPRFPGCAHAADPPGDTRDI